MGFAAGSAAALVRRAAALPLVKMGLTILVNSRHTLQRLAGGRT